MTSRFTFCSFLILASIFVLLAAPTPSYSQSVELNIGQIEDDKSPIEEIDMIEPSSVHMDIPTPEGNEVNPLFWDGVNNAPETQEADVFEEEVDTLINNFEQGVSSLDSDPSSAERPSRDYIDSDFSTVFFTKWELETLIETRQISLKRTLKEKEQFIDMAIADITGEDEDRALTAEELAAIERRERLVAQAKEQRDVRLSGIYYKNDDDWVVWLNGQRIEPDDTPQAVVEMNVQKDFVEIKWLDYYTNKIFPIRLRPHQIFNLDELVFIPERS